MAVKRQIFDLLLNKGYSEFHAASYPAASFYRGRGIKGKSRRRQDFYAPPNIGFSACFESQFKRKMKLTW
jgi:hypothetical protein